MTPPDDRSDKAPPIKPLPSLNPTSVPPAADDEATRAILRPTRVVPPPAASDFDDENTRVVGPGAMPIPMPRALLDSPPRAQPAPPSLPSNPLLQPSFAATAATAAGAHRHVARQRLIQHPCGNHRGAHRLGGAPGRPLPDPVAPRARRHGHGLQGARSVDRPRRGGEVPACLAGRRRGVPRALPARVARGRRAVAPATSWWCTTSARSARAPTWRWS